MPIDEPSLLPDPPPPRPARRDAAIDSALRRFDGIEDQPRVASAPAGRRGFGGRPQFGALVTASLVVVVGLPAALIAIRNSEQPAPALPAAQAPAEASNDKLVAERSAKPVAVTADSAESAIRLPARPPANLPASDRRRAASDARDDAGGSSPALADFSAAPAPAPPPPPSPSPPPAGRQEGYAAERESSDNEIAVTGSRIAAPNALEERIRDGRGKSRPSALKVMAPATAPDWVLNDQDYRRFLTQLQGAVRRNDRPAVVGLARLPLRVKFANGAKTYRDSKSVIADYELIFTARVRNAILAQRFEDLFGRDRGIMIGDGAVWFDHVCRNQSCSPPGPVRIRAINP